MLSSAVCTSSTLNLEIYVIGWLLINNARVCILYAHICPENIIDISEAACRLMSVNIMRTRGRHPALRAKSGVQPKSRM